MGDQHGATTEEEIIFRSPFPAVAIPENMNVPQFVLGIDGNDKYADNVALVEASTGKEYTYAQVISLTKRVAAALVGTLGVQKGDVVLLLLPNMAEYPIIVLGIMLAGAVFSGINPSAHVTEIEKQMQDSGARLLVTISSIYEKLRPLAFMSGVTIIMADEEQQVADGNSVPLAKLFSTTDSFSASLPEVNDSDLCALPYSSGTTGASKGVMLSHRNLIANLCSTLFDVDESVLGKFTTLGLMPFFHIYGITGICCATLRNRGKVVVMSRFDLRQFMDALINYDVNFAPIVPPIMLALVKNPIVNEYDLARLQLKAIMTAAAPLAPDLQRAFHEKFPGVEVQEAYGLTEHSCITLTHCAPTNNIRGRAKRKSVGFILPNLEVKFIDPETGKSLPRNCTGEICVRSQCVMRGYYQKPRETEMTLDTEGWLHTGDVGFIDDDDDVFIVDRIKELIKYKGFQVAPAELEAILLSHPSVDDAAVVPLADEEAGEIPVAFVVKAASATETEEDISNFVASQVSGYKKVRAVHFVASIPKSSSGKILRRLLRDNLVNQTTVIVSSN